MVLPPLPPAQLPIITPGGGSGNDNDNDNEAEVEPQFIKASAISLDCILIEFNCNVQFAVDLDGFVSKILIDGFPIEIDTPYILNNLIYIPRCGVEGEKRLSSDYTGSLTIQPGAVASVSSGLANILIADKTISDEIAPDLEEVYATSLNTIEIIFTENIALAVNAADFLSKISIPDLNLSEAGAIANSNKVTITLDQAHKLTDPEYETNGVVIDAGVVKDANGNLNECFENECIDNAIPPKVIALSPANGSTGISINATLSITFDHLVNIGPDEYVAIYKASNGEKVAEFDLWSSSGFGENTVTFSIPGDLEQGTKYYVNIPPSAFSNYYYYESCFDGISGTDTWSFTTEGGVGENTGWSTVGSAGVLGTCDSSSKFSVYYDETTDTPYGAFIDNSGNVQVEKLIDGDWYSVGDSPGQGTASISLCVSSGVPYIAYRDVYSLIVKKYEDGMWETLGGGYASLNTVDCISMNINNGIPYVAFAEFNVSYGWIGKLIRYDDSAIPSWVSIGEDSFSVQQATDITLCFNDDVPYVAFKDSNASGKLSVRKFFEGNWSNVGSAGFSTGSVIDPSMCIYNGIPCVSYCDFSQDKKLIVKIFDGSSWVQVGDDISTDASWYTAICFFEGKPCVAYSDYDIDLGERLNVTVKSFDENIPQSLWNSLGNAPFVTNEINGVKILSTGGGLYVAFKEKALDNTYRIKFMVFDSILVAY